MNVYVETSAAVKLIFEEAESIPLKEWFDRLVGSGATPFSSMLVEMELRRAAIREQTSQQVVTEALDRFDLFELDRSDDRGAGLLPGQMRSMDALHIAAALRLGADVMVSYDDR